MRFAVFHWAEIWRCWLASNKSFGERFDEVSGSCWRADWGLWGRRLAEPERWNPTFSHLSNPHPPSIPANPPHPTPSYPLHPSSKKHRHRTIPNKLNRPHPEAAQILISRKNCFRWLPIYDHFCQQTVPFRIPLPSLQKPNKHKKKIPASP